MVEELIIESFAELESRLGTELVRGAWRTITQEQIHLFAAATGDRQWIHTDVERAAVESPFGGTIAHGFLTLSLLSSLVGEAIRLATPPRLAVNYGLNRVRFISPVRAGSRIRASITLSQLERDSSYVQLVWSVRIEGEASEKPLCTAEWVIRYYL
jgi:acyl dehydratase